jgi:hypothetical protein
MQNPRSMKYELESNEIELKPETNWIRIITNTGINLPLHNQTFEETQKVINKNYVFVKTHYESKVCNKISSIDVERVSLKIVIFYFQMYNL